MNHSEFRRPPTNVHFGGFVLQCYEQYCNEFFYTSIFVYWDMYFCRMKSEKGGFLSQRICTFEIIMYIVNLLSKEYQLITQ